MNLKTTIVLAGVLCLGFGVEAAWATGGVTLGEALQQALTRHPALAAAAAEIDAREGAATQAGLLPNPAVEVEFEELGGPGGFDALETTLSLSQDIELGGKRPRRQEAARLQASLARADGEIRRLDLEAEVTTAFYTALAAQEKAKLQEELVGIATDSLDTVAERVKAGKVSPIEETQAKLEMAAASIELRRSWAGWGAARSALAATWGGTGEELAVLDGRLDELPQAPSLEELTAALPTTPALARWNTEIALGEATRELERAGSVPDLGLTGGVRTLNIDNTTTFLVAISMPLPLFDRNQGAVAEATAGLARTRAERLSTERGLRAEVEAVHQEMAAAREEAEALRDTLLPGAREAYEAIREGYQWGKFEYLALLDAQRTLLEARGQLVDATAAFHLARVRLDRLTTTSVASENP